jgi:NitT/TauT family transport system permease protein
MRLINRRPDRVAVVFVAAVPFALAFIAYAVGSDIRLSANPQDKLLPAPSTIFETARVLMTEPDKRSGEILFWSDTVTSLRRLGLGVAIASLIGLAAGLVIGLIPWMRATFLGFVAVLSMVPPLAVLPILFIILGLGEVSKVALIVIGITPFLVRDIAQRVIELPRELIVKAETLGASSLTIAMRVALPQILPRLIQAVRLALGPAWLFLIAAEAIASEAGLGYRIFLVRRYLAMDVILTYVAWITLLGFIIDRLLAQISRRAFQWAEP